MLERAAGTDRDSVNGRGSSYIALGLERGVTGGVLGILVGPEVPAGLVERDPVLLHERFQVTLAIGLKPFVNGLALVRRHRCT